MLGGDLAGKLRQVLLLLAQSRIPVESLLDEADDFLAHPGLDEIFPDPALVDRADDGLVVRVARNDDRNDVGILFAGGGEHGVAVDIRHIEIAEQNGDLARLEDMDGLRRRTGRDENARQVGQLVRQQFQHRLFVVNGENSIRFTAFHDTRSWQRA